VIHHTYRHQIKIFLTVAISCCPCFYAILTTHCHNTEFQEPSAKSVNIFRIPHIRTPAMLVLLKTRSSKKLRPPVTTTAFRPPLGPAQPPIQWVPGALSLGIKRLGREADHSLPSSAEVKEWVELYLHSPNTPSWRGAQLKKAEGTTLPLP
jgi:hypothetical protein